MKAANQGGAAKVALVTGGARGIGRKCALHLAEKGFSIVLVDVLVPEMNAVRQEIEGAGRNAICLEGDVADHQRAKDIVKEAHATFGRIDVLLNNAGRPSPKGILEINEEEFDRTIAINLKSCFNYIQPVVP